MQLTKDILQQRLQDTVLRYNTGNITSDVQFDYLEIDSYRTPEDYEIDSSFLDMKSHEVSLVDIPSRFRGIRFAVVNGKIICYMKESTQYDKLRARALLNYTYYKSEYDLKCWFDSQNIKYIKEYPIHRIHTDFYLPDQNVFVEYNGSHTIDRKRCDMLSDTATVVNLTVVPKSWDHMMKFTYIPGSSGRKTVTVDPMAKYGMNRKLVEFLYQKKADKQIIGKKELLEICKIKNYSMVIKRVLNLYKKYEELRVDLFFKFNNLNELKSTLSLRRHGKKYNDIEWSFV